MVIFSFSGSAAAPSKFIYISLHQVNEFRPDKPLSATLGFLPGGEEENRRKFLPVYAMLYLMADDSSLKSLEKRISRLEEKAKSCCADQTEDEQFGEAVKLVSRYDKISPSLLQRKLNIGYARAARIADRLEKRGFITATGNHHIYQSVLGRRKKFLGLF